MHPWLYKAAKEGDVRRFSGIDGRNITEEKAMRIEDGMFLKRTQHGNNNILHIAARAGRNTFVAEALRRFPFLSDQVNSQGDTPLLVAARFGHLQVVKTFAEPNNELPMQDDDTATAVESGTNSRSSRRQSDVEEGLVDHQLEQGTGQDNVVTVENGTNSSNSSRRQRVVEEGLFDDQLEQATSLENGTNLRDYMATALENEINSSRSRRLSDVEEELDDHQLDVAIPSHWRVTNEQATSLENGTNLRDMATALENEINSSRSRRLSDVEDQLDVAIPSHWRVTNEQGTTITTALHEGLRNGHQDVARYLLGSKPEMANFDNLAGESPLFLAAESRCELFMSDILLSTRPYSTNGPDGLNALHASRHCCGTIISELIKQNPDLMRKLDNRGKAAIHHAVEADCWVLLDRMLEADPSIALFPDAEGYTALLRASSRGCWKGCEWILRVCPESIEARNDKGQHALHLARSSTHATKFGFVGKIPPEMWELVNVGDDEGNTPLHLAVKEDHYAKTILLTSSASIDLGAVNKEGLTALDLCESDWKHINIKSLMWFHLRRHGASRGRHPNVHKVPAGRLSFTFHSRDEDMKPFINTLALIAALIGTLTFAAAFTMPGGYNSSPDNLGVATLAKKAALKAFVLSDTLAMCCSILSLFLLLRAMKVDHNVTFSLTNTSGILLGIALYATLVAFISGMFAVIAPKALWVAIVVCIVCSVASFYLSPATVQRFSFLTLFMPTILIKDLRRFIQNEKRMGNKKREQDYVRSLFERGSPDTTYRVSTTDIVAG